MSAGSLMATLSSWSKRWPDLVFREEQSCDRSVLVEGEMSPLGGDKFLGPQQAVEAEEQGGSRAWKAACAEPPPDGCDELWEKGNGSARQLMLLPGAEQAPAAGHVPFSARQVVLQPTVASDA